MKELVPRCVFNFYCFEQAAFKYSFDGHAVIASLVPPHWPRGRGGVSASRPSSGPQLMQGRSTRARRSVVGTPPEPLFRPQSPRRLANGAAGGRRPRGVCSPAEGGAPVGHPPPPSSRPEQFANRCGGAHHRARFWASCSPQRFRRRSDDCAGAVGVSHPRAPHLDRRPPTPGSPSIRRPRTHVDICPTTPLYTPLPPPHCSSPVLPPCARLPFVLFYFFLPSPFHRHGHPWVSAGSAWLVDIACLSSPPRRRVPFRHCRGSPRIPPPRCFRRSHRPGRCYSARFPEPFSSSPWTEPSAG